MRYVRKKDMHLEDPMTFIGHRIMQGFKHPGGFAEIGDYHIEVRQGQWEVLTSDEFEQEFEEFK